MTTDLLADNANDEITIDPNKDYLSELVGPGKKFADPKELAKGKYHSDTHIKVLETKFDQLREDYLKLKADRDAAATLKELMDQYETTKQPVTSNTPPADTVREPAIKPEQIKAMLNEEIRNYETSQKQQANANLVKAKLTERFGNNYQSEIRNQIEDLGLTREDFNDLARRSPAVLLKTLGLDQPAKTDPFQTPPKSAVNFKPQGAQKRSLSYYHELKKTNPKLYYDPKINVQMDKDAQELGEAFFDV